jgi:1-acyl-sn-glycerol-3-phosphate acyltransferase
MKSLCYKLVKCWLKPTLLIFYKKIEVIHKSRVLKKGPLIIVANHQNTLLDPLLIAAFIPRTFFFLLRASFFNSKIGRVMAKSLNMMPIYRQRDGVNTIEKNEVIFNQCVQLLNKGKTILIFPEGSHLGRWTLRPFQKGFARIAQAYLNQNNNQPLHILPIGLNYFDLSQPANKVVIRVGEVITLTPSEKTRSPAFLSELKDQAFEGLRKTVLFIPNDEQYEALANDCKHILAEESNTLEALTKAQTHVKAGEIQYTSTYQPKNSFTLKKLLWPFHFIPHLVANHIRKGIKDPQFKPSVYVVISLVIHTIQTAIITALIINSL